jgi:DNA repair protein RecO (recombination protein O)
MLITTDGLVISRREFSETSCYIDVFTKEYSVIEVLARGVKKINSPLAQPTGLFIYSTFCLKKKNLRYTLNSAVCKYSFHRLSGDLKRFALAAYFVQLIKFTATPEQDSGGVLRLMLIALYELCRDRYTVEQIKANFETSFARESGFGGEFPADKPDSPEQYLLRQLEVKSFKALDYFKNLQ